VRGTPCRGAADIALSLSTVLRKDNLYKRGGVSSINLEKNRQEDITGHSGKERKARGYYGEGTIEKKPGMCRGPGGILSGNEIISSVPLSFYREGSLEKGMRLSQGIQKIQDTSLDQSTGSRRKVPPMGCSFLGGINKGVEKGCSL